MRELEKSKEIVAKKREMENDREREVRELEKALASERLQQNKLRDIIAALRTERDSWRASANAHKSNLFEKVRDVEDAQDMLARMREARDVTSHAVKEETERAERLLEDLHDAEDLAADSRRAAAELQTISLTMQRTFNDTVHTLQKEARERENSMQAALEDAHAQLDNAYSRIEWLQQEVTLGAEALQNATRELAGKEHRLWEREESIDAMNMVLAQRGSELRSAQALVSRLKDENDFASREAEDFRLKYESEKERSGAKLEEMQGLLLFAERVIAEQRLEVQDLSGNPPSASLRSWEEIRRREKELEERELTMDTRRRDFDKETQEERARWEVQARRRREQEKQDEEDRMRRRVEEEMERERGREKELERLRKEFEREREGRERVEREERKRKAEEGRRHSASQTEEADNEAVRALVKSLESAEKKLESARREHLPCEAAIKGHLSEIDRLTSELEAAETEVKSLCRNLEASETRAEALGSELGAHEMKVVELESDRTVQEAD
jgi:chromosome segregation ATPase